MKQKKIDFYEKNLDRVNYWLQFAEAKNAAIIAFVVAALAVFFSLNNIIIVAIVTPLYIIGLILSVMSLKPKGNMDANEKIGEYKSCDNSLYWKDIAKYSKIDYVKKINKEFFINNQEESDVELMFAEEIITNARIAQFKYEKVSLAINFLIIGSSFFPVALIYEAYRMLCKLPIR